MASGQDQATARPPAEERLDQALVTRGLARSRSQAADLVRRGFVRVAGRAVTKPAMPVTDLADVTLATDAPAYVGRGAEKLVAALAAFRFTCDGRTAIDVGASTGGFTEVLLRQGARHVYAVDVGQGQLHETLRHDPRVTPLEKTDARALDARLVAEPVDAVVADVSFISLKKALPAALALATPGAWLVALVKPQFEVGRDGVGRGGIVRDDALRLRAVDDVCGWLRDEMGWHVEGSIPSPLPGGDGNQEFLVGARK